MRPNDIVVALGTGAEGQMGGAASQIIWFSFDFAFAHFCWIFSSLPAFKPNMF